MASGLDEVFGSFVAEARRLNSLPELDSIELDYSARHLCEVLHIDGVKVFIVDGMVDKDHTKTLMGTYQNKGGDFGFRNAIRISQRTSKDERTEAFVHEMYHRWQHADLEAFRLAVHDGTFEKQAYAFTARVMKECGIATPWRDA